MHDQLGFCRVGVLCSGYICSTNVMESMYILVYLYIRQNDMCTGNGDKILRDT